MRVASPNARRDAARRYAGLVLDPPTYGHGPAASHGDWKTTSIRS